VSAHPKSCRCPECMPHLHAMTDRAELTSTDFEAFCKRESIPSSLRAAYFVVWQAATLAQAERIAAHEAKLAAAEADIERWRERWFKLADRYDAIDAAREGK
jgi:hypothetical protein